MTLSERFFFPADIGEIDRRSDRTAAATARRRPSSPIGPGRQGDGGGSATPGGATVRVEHVTKSFAGARRDGADAPVLRGISFQLRPGEFVAIVGRSGCGKSTLLRLLAGLDAPTGGRIEVEGNVPLDGTGSGAEGKAVFPPGVRLMFQDPRLLPWRTVLQNVGTGLRGNWRETALAALRAVGLEERAHEWPSVLSGGQRQRVALARAIVNSPSVLLLDEPLGALDLKLRQEMQVFLKALQRDLGITFIYVTHDQEEALTMSDRLAVFNEGRIEQIGSPADVYEHPHTEFVAGFVGVSNVLERDGERVTIRPEKIHMSEAGGDGEPGVIRQVVYLGSVTRYVVTLDSGGELTVLRQNLETSSQEALEDQGKRVRLSWSPEHTYTIGKEGL
jgi:putative spermidine/putrescine transport system ATP-binding protein